MGEPVKVDTGDLRKKAQDLRSVPFGDPDTVAGDLQPPDVLATTQTAVNNLDDNAKHLAAQQTYAKGEAQRIAAALDAVAAAYDAVDEAARRSLDEGGPPPTPVMPKGIDAPALPVPPALASPASQGSEGVMYVEDTQGALHEGDGGGSLVSAKERWVTNGTGLQDAASTMWARVVNWEGDAADAAYGRMFDFGVWLKSLGTAWVKLGGEAQRIVDAHQHATSEHQPVYDLYEQLRASLESSAQPMTILNEMGGLQVRSEGIREVHAREVPPNRVDVGAPPPPVPSPNTPVESNGDPRILPSDQFKTLNERSSAGAGGGGSSGGSGGAAGGQGAGKGAPVPAAASLDRSPLGTPSGAAAKAGGDPAGAGSGSGSGGSPGSGSSGGGLPGGGLPGLGDPAGMHPSDFPTDPGIRPAAADAGSGGGGAGGGGGGGLGKAPLGPSVGGVSVGPAPGGSGTAGGTGAAAAGGAAAGGGMGGGMGPHGGHGAGGGKEKRRTPGLSPDEAVYTEDRPWTAPVIGSRRRQTVDEPKDAQ